MTDPLPRTSRAIADAASGETRENVDRIAGKMDRTPFVFEDDAPPSGADLRAACEVYLRENGWESDEGPDALYPDSPWFLDGFAYHHSLSEALDVQWARDGIGGAT